LQNTFHEYLMLCKPAPNVWYVYFPPTGRPEAYRTLRPSKAWMPWLKIDGAINRRSAIRMAKEPTNVTR